MKTRGKEDCVRLETIWFYILDIFGTKENSPRNKYRINNNQDSSADSLKISCNKLPSTCTKDIRVAIEWAFLY